MALIHTHHTVPTQSKLVTFFPSGTGGWCLSFICTKPWKGASDNFFVWQFSVETFMFNAHQPAKAPFTSQGSQDLVKLLPHWGSLVSLSDLKFHFRCSSSHPFPNGMKLIAISKICVSAYKYNKSSKIQLIDASQAAKSLAQQTVLLISKKGASCVSFGDRLKMVEAAWAAETCATGHRVWASFSTKPRKGTSAQKHEKSKFSSRKLWVYFEQQKSVSVCFCLETFHVQCQLFKI